MAMRRLSPDDYLTKVYSKGIHVVALYRDNDTNLGRRALSQLDLASMRFHHSQGVNLWACEISTPDHAESVQVIKLPQFRFFYNGSETHSHVGVMEAEDILSKVFSANSTE